MDGIGEEHTAAEWDEVTGFVRGAQEAGVQMFLGPAGAEEPSAAELQRMVESDREVGLAIARARQEWLDRYGKRRRKALEAFGLPPERGLFG